MTYTNTDKLTNFRNAFSHALQYPETSKAVIDLLLESACRELGVETAKDFIREFKLIP